MKLEIKTLIIYGQEFSSFENALDYLDNRGVIDRYTGDDISEIEDLREALDIPDLTWKETFDDDSKEVVGILGIEFTAEELLYQRDEVDHAIGLVDELLEYAELIQSADVIIINI